MDVETVFSFLNTVQTIQAEHVLLKAGLHVLVMPIPLEINAGCGLCLRLPPSEGRDAERILQENAIAPQKIFTRTIKNGKSEFSILGENSHEK